MVRHRILIVDDDEGVRSALRRILASEAHIVLEADSPRTALSVLADNPVSVIITDERMPACSGRDFMRIVRKRYPRVARIMLTAYADTKTVIEAVNDGEIFRFFTKPWDDVELVAAVRQAIAAFEETELECDILSKLKERDDDTKELEDLYPGITTVSRDPDGRVVIENDDPNEPNPEGGNQENETRNRPRRR